jgi:hypothetical protein
MLISAFELQKYFSQKAYPVKFQCCTLMHQWSACRDTSQLPEKNIGQSGMPHAQNKWDVPHALEVV